MLDTLSGNAAPLLMSLTGENYLGRAKKKINWKKALKKVGKVAAWVAAPQVMATYTAAKAVKGALKRKQQKNIANLQIERAKRAKNLADAQKEQAVSKQAQVAESLKARAAAQAEAAAAQEDSIQQEAQAPEQETAYEDTPVDEAPIQEEEIVENTEDGAEQGAEMLGYSRSNDDYFVGAAALKKPLKPTVKTVKAVVKSTQLKTVPAAKKTIPPLYYVIGAVGIGALIFGKQITKALR